jgi:hypothetical protein
MSSSRATAKITFVGGQSHAFGWSSTHVRARPVEVLAFLWDVKKRYARSTDNLERSIDEAPNGHNMLFYVKKKPIKPLDSRSFLARIIWRRERDDG